MSNIPNIDSSPVQYIYYMYIYCSLWGGGEYGSSLFNEGEESEFMTFLKIKDRVLQQSFEI